jgi:hypothetical protein
MLGLSVGLNLSPPKSIIVSNPRKRGDHSPKLGPNIIEEEVCKQFNEKLLETYLFIDIQTT